MTASGMIVVEATREIRNTGLVHSVKGERTVTIPRGALGIVSTRTLPREGVVAVVFEHGSANSVTMEVPADFLVKEGARPLPLP